MCDPTLGAKHVGEARITVAICTYNRAKYLSHCLEGLRAQSAPSTCYEVIVVDNGSSDATAAVVAQMRNHLPNLRYVLETARGLSHARNRATAETNTEYIAFLDDDAIPRSNWLAYLLAALKSRAATTACVGGRVDLIWERARPDWLLDELLEVLTWVDWSDEPRVLTEREHVAGANMAFRTDTLRAIGGFDPRLGRVGKRLLSNEDVAVQRLLQKVGLTIFYEPRAAVDHFVPETRLRKEWFVERFFQQGISDGVMHSRVNVPTVRSTLVSCARVLAAFLCRPRSWTSLALDADNGRQFAVRCQGRRRIGTLVGLYSARHDRAGRPSSVTA